MDAVQIERSSESKQTLTAVGLTLAAMISIQLGAAISKPIMQQLGTFGTTFVRLSFAAIILLIWIRPSFRSYNRSQWLSAFSLGASMAFMTMCFFAAIETIPLGLAVAIEFMGPLLVATLYGSGRFRLICPMIAAAGIICLTSGSSLWGNDMTGMLFAFCSAIGWGAYIILTKRAGEKFHGLEGLAVSMMFAALVALPVGSGQLYTNFSTEAFIMAGLLALLTPLIPYAFEFMALRNLKPSAFGILVSLEPAIGATVGFLMLHQALSIVQIAGIALVITASVISTR